jgi:hypothetical protein
MTTTECQRCHGDIPEARRRRNAIYCSDMCGVAQRLERYRQDHGWEKRKELSSTCEQCHGDIPEARHRRRAKFCSRQCERDRNVYQWQRQNAPDREQRKGLSTGVVGAISEMQVCADLLAKGYEVFRAVSPSCSCDVMILLDHRAFRVEVRTGYYLRSGKLVYMKDRLKAEVMAVCTPSGIIYLPSLDTLK